MGDPLGRVEVGVGRIVLDLDVDERAIARVERDRQRRHVIRQLARHRLADHAAVGEHCVVMHDERVVCGPTHVELDSLGAHLDGAPERSDRVLGFGARSAAVGDDDGHTQIVADHDRHTAQHPFAIWFSDGP